MITVYFEDGASVDFDGTVQGIKSIFEDHLYKYQHGNPFIIVNGVLINIEKITHIVEVTDNER